MVAEVAARSDLHLRANRAERCPFRPRSTDEQEGWDSGGEPIISGRPSGFPWGEFRAQRRTGYLPFFLDMGLSLVDEFFPFCGARTRQLTS
jgi:hypothetical protein